MIGCYISIKISRNVTYKVFRLFYFLLAPQLEAMSYAGLQPTVSVERMTPTMDEGKLD